MIYRGTAAVVVLWLTLGQRWTLGYSGNRLEWLRLLAIVAVAVLWVSARPRRSGVVGVWMTLRPLLFLMGLLPFLGVMFLGYGVTTLYAWTVPASALALVGFGYVTAVQGRSLQWPVFGVIVAHGLYGLGQALDRLHLIPASSWSWAASWDTRVQTAYKLDYLIVGRSTGLFVNANMFGLWSMLAAVYSAGFLTGWQRRVGVVLGVVGVVVSQSRTAWLGLAACTLVLLVRGLREGAVARRIGSWGFWVAGAVVGLWFSGVLPLLVESDLVQRLGEGLAVLGGGGVYADQNLGARVSAWGQAWTFSPQYPFGTWGPPQVLFGSFIDNEYVSVFLQGSILLLAAYLLALTTPLLLRRRGVPQAGTLGVMALVVAIASFTMGPLDLPACVALVWLAGGWAVGRFSDGDDDRDPRSSVAALAGGVPVERRPTATATR